MFGPYSLCATVSYPKRIRYFLEFHAHVNVLCLTLALLYESEVVTREVHLARDMREVHHARDMREVHLARDMSEVHLARDMREVHLARDMSEVRPVHDMSEVCSARRCSLKFESRHYLMSKYLKTRHLKLKCI